MRLEMRPSVSGGERAYGNDIGIGAVISHDANALQWCQDGEGLSQFAVDAGAADLFDDNGVGGTQGCQALLVNCPDDANCQPGARKGMAPHPFFGQAESRSYLAYLVFEENAQWFNQLQGHVFGQATYVMVCLDARGCGRGIVAGALDHVGVEGALRQEGDGSALFFQAASLFLKDADELFTDDPAFLLRVDDIGKPGQEPLTRIDHDKRDMQVNAEGIDDLISFARAQAAGIDEDTGQLVANGLVYQQGCDSRIYAA